LSIDFYFTDKNTLTKFFRGQSRNDLQNVGLDNDDYEKLGAITIEEVLKKWGFIGTIDTLVNKNGSTAGDNSIQSYSKIYATGHVAGKTKLQDTFDCALK